MLQRILLCAAVLFSATALQAVAKTHFIAPIGSGKSGAADGSEGSPWASVADALRSGKVAGGDKIVLKDGDHGALVLNNVSFSSTVTIVAQNAKKAHVEYIDISGNSKNLLVDSLSVWPNNPYNRPGTLIFTAPTASNLVLEDLDVRAGQDAGNYLKWSAAEWRNRAVDGAMIYSTKTVVRRSLFTGVRFGVAILGDDGRAAGNRISGFSADALRGNGARAVIRGNYVENCVSVDGNHADGFQAFTQTSIVGLRIERNKILEWTANPSHPLRCYLQGIGMFDGFYDDLVIRNNVVSVRMGHGISVMGTRNAQITHNTVVQADGLPGNWPWIGVFDHKNGSLSTDVLVANNIAMKFMGATDAQRRMVFERNAAISYPAKVFENVAAFDYRPLASSGYVDKANPNYSAPVDIRFFARPYSGASDLGAYEIGSSAVKVNYKVPNGETLAAVKPTNAGTSQATAAGSADGAKFVSAP